LYPFLSILPVSIGKIYADNKDMRLDILAEIEGNEQIDIEIQNKNMYNLIDREDMYGSALYHMSLEEGEKKGSKEQKLEIAKNMLSKNMSVDTIAEITGLTKEEIENL
jgi:predicted transposase YdaD